MVLVMVATGKGYLNYILFDSIQKGQNSLAEYSLGNYDSCALLSQVLFHTGDRIL